ncbi:MAG: hypothetical protein ABEJ35_04905 [Halobacteriaceae archaeon]
MKRRTLLRNATAALLAAAAGCSAEAGLPGAPSSGPTAEAGDSDCPSTESEPRGQTPPAQARIDVVNETDADQRAAVELVHVATPHCRYAEPACGAPTTRTTLVDRSVTVSAGTTRSLPVVSLDLDPTDSTVDAYVWTVRALETDDTRRGLSASAVETVGRARAESYDWLVYPGDVRLTATLTATGLDLEVTPNIDADGIDIPSRTIDGEDQACGVNDSLYGPAPPETTTGTTREERTD